MRASLVVPALAFTFALAVIACRAERLLNVPGDPNHGGWALMDFRDTVYYPARALLDGRNPYDATAHVRQYPVGNAFALYLPAALVIFAPIVLLPYVWAEAAWMALMIAAAVAAVALARTLAGRPATLAGVLLGAALLLLSRPGQMNALLGQGTLVYVLGTYVALAYADRAPAVAVVGLAVAMLKPTYGLPLAVLLAARGDRRVAVGGAMLAGALSLAVAMIFIPALLSPETGRLIAASYAQHASRPLNATSTSLFRVDAPALLGRIAGREFGFLGDVAIGAVVLGLAGVTVHRLRTRSDPGSRALEVTVACLGILLCAYHQAYDLVLLAWPIAELAPRARPAPRVQVVLLALLALLVLPFVNFAASETGVAVLGLAGTAWTLAASLNAAALAAALLVSVVAAWGRSVQTTPAAASRSSVAASMPISA